MTSFLKKYFQRAVKIGFICLAIISMAFSLPVVAEEVTGTVNTGVQTGVGGVVIAAPTANVSAGTYTSNQSVTLTASGSSSIHYTTDGTTPTCSTGTTYSSAITISSTTTLKAISCYPNSQASTVASFAYTLQCATTSVSNGTVGAYSACTITCNSGYTLSGSTCVASGGGGGGGGGGGTSSSAVINSFTASPATITLGQSASLSWSVSNTTSMTIDQGVGTLPSTATGSKTVSPTATTVYTLSATGGGSTATSKVTVTVTTAAGAPIGQSANNTPSVSNQSGAHPNGTLILDGKTVYLIKDGKRVGFRDANEYKSHGYNFGQAVAANAQDKAMPQAEFVQKALEGTLVLDASDGRTVYMIGLNGVKRGFTSMTVFTGLGYNLSGVPKINLSDYPTGAPIGSSSEPHPEGALVKEGKTIWWIRNNQKTGFESMQVFNTYGFSLGDVTKANPADIALPQGPLIKFRDGTLVKDGSTYYLISDGKKKSFASVSDLTNRGYKTVNVITASLANYESGGAVE